MWRALGLAILLAFEILVKKLRVEDSEAYLSHFTTCQSGLSRFWQKCLP